ncbi:DUF1648 domain-containing protein [Kribbella sp. NBC_01245]|uniref:DUF1648 domain-containing protein n=1 Tax=Kribbella sp. NBC_01245 TaxID=2903578 RepID=UPI002E28B76C|nr:DUF1648 domain-containing protein [Kribbella sp. NBC_01245]
MIRKVLALLVIALPVIAVGLVLLTMDLPDPIPSHWNSSGEADRTMSRTVFAVLNLAVTGGAALAAAGFARIESARWSVTACAFAAYLMGSLAVLTAYIAGAFGGHSGTDLPWLGLVIALAVAFAGPAIVALLWPTPLVVGDASVPDAELPHLDLAPGERAVYVTEIRSRGFAALAVSCAVIGLILVLAVDALIGICVLAVTVAGAVLQRATLRVDANGVRVVFGPGVRINIPLAEIRQASVEQIQPMQWGGWGYRVTPGKRGLILRAGPGLVLDLTNGTRFAITLDTPEPPAALLNTLLTH